MTSPTYASPRWPSAKCMSEHYFFASSIISYLIKCFWCWGSITWNCSKHHSLQSSKHKVIFIQIHYFSNDLQQNHISLLPFQSLLPKPPQIPRFLLFVHSYAALFARFCCTCVYQIQNTIWHRVCYNNSGLSPQFTLAASLLMVSQQLSVWESLLEVIGTTSPSMLHISCLQQFTISFPRKALYWAQLLSVLKQPNFYQNTQTSA